MGALSYRRFFAWLLERMGEPHEEDVIDRKRRLLAAARGTVVEIGPGAGACFRYYPPGVEVVGIEPNEFLHRRLRAAADREGLTVHPVGASAEALPLLDASVDAVVSSLVLCSVADLQAVLQEILRVLKPGGGLLFVEHVAAPEGSRLRRWQRCIRPLWRALGDGCVLDRETWRAIERAGFDPVEYDRFDAEMPLPLVRPHIVGVATKPAPATAVGAGGPSDDTDGDERARPER